ncbi:MAG: hypothetical protein WBI40_09325 [Methylococcaceae bacterium]
MDISDFIDRLKTECPILKFRVFGAAELAIAKPTTMQPPCAFVIPMSEKAESNSLMNALSQRTTVQIGVVIAIRNFSDTRGESGHKQLEIVRSEIMEALLNWEPQNASTPTEFVAGQLAGYDNLTLRWNDIFQTQFYYRA